MAQISRFALWRLPGKLRRLYTGTRTVTSALTCTVTRARTPGLLHAMSAYALCGVSGVKLLRIEARLLALTSVATEERTDEMGPAHRFRNPNFWDI